MTSDEATATLRDARGYVKAAIAKLAELVAYDELEQVISANFTPDMRRALMCLIDADEKLA